MAIIWLIELDDQRSDGIYKCLANDFPIRRIASIESLRSIYAMEEEERRPQLVIAREPICSDRMKILACAHTLQRLMAQCMVALTADSSPIWLEVTENLGIPRLALNLTNGFSLKAQIDLLLALNAKKLNKRQLKRNQSDVIVVGDISFHPQKNAIEIQGASAESLLPKEARILEILASRPNACVTRSLLADLVWPGITVSDRTLDSHVSRLRRKLESSFECGIESIYGEGYRLRVGT